MDVTADATGRLHIIIQADISISCPVIGVFVQSGNIGQFVPVEPRQRLVMGFELYKSGSDLKNAKSSTGKSIFPNTTIPDSTFDEVVKMLQTAVGFLKNTNPLGTGMAPSVPNPGFLTAESDVLSFGYRADLGSEFVSSDEEKSILGAVGDVVETVVERIGTVVKEVVKVGIQVVSGALNFIAKIAGKLYRWALNVEGMIIRRYAGFPSHARAADDHSTQCDGVS